MMRRSNLGSVAALWLLAIVTAIVSVSCTGTNTNTKDTNTKSPTPDPCVSITEKEIVDNIYSELAKVPELRTQLGTINVVAKARAVTLWGWVDTDAERTQVIDIAKNSKCVTSVSEDNFYVEANLGANNPLRPIPGGGCVPNYIRCGDICIPVGTGCGLEKQAASKETGTNTNASTNSNSTSSSNSNTGANSNTNTKKY